MKKFSTNRIASIAIVCLLAFACLLSLRPVELLAATKDSEAKNLSYEGFSVNIKDPDMWKECEHAGRVVDERYPTHWYAGETPHDHVKYMTVYLPYGYNPKEQYDVLILIPGMDMTENCYLNKAHAYGHDQLGHVFLRNLIDNAIDQGLMKPMIIANINYFGATIPGGPNLEQDCNHVSKELRNDIIPYLVRTFSTYATGTTEKELQEAREHFGIFGFSYSSTMVVKRLMADLLDIASWYGAQSVFFTDETYAIKNLNAKQDEFPLSFFYCGCGDRDDAHDQTVDMYNIITDGCKWMKRGENTDLVVLPDTGHSEKTYDTAIYNCCVRFFKDGSEA